MVINIGALKSQNYELVYEDIRAVVEASAGYIVKVIVETIFLTDDEKIAASFLAAEAGATFVKTCTGFNGGGASAADVALMKKTVSYKEGLKVKASAGIRTYEACIEMLQAGADRIGTFVFQSWSLCLLDINRLFSVLIQLIWSAYHAEGKIQS